ncbi:hypothetical protein DAPPUDRAFT_332852 [Daphnia pulex]|uniref:Uncharacterized protein n=1 Tax=Daphnia pulex TaxID=6669 RepID=E9HR43_DAPPU|nr:hypothetical protein DAPPUDRAFT_332852 [Daphnia pulex]|eukprot:EFX65768.1 hypothetical protein DAPPUDRAFT_332852 [Daphnia pulex]
MEIWITFVIFKLENLTTTNSFVRFIKPGEVCTSWLQSNVRMDSLQSSSERCD